MSSVIKASNESALHPAAPENMPAIAPQAEGPAALPGQTPVSEVRSAPVLREFPLAELSRDAAAYLATRDGPVGLAVVLPNNHAVYAANGDQAFHMASVAKVVIMAAVLDAARAEERVLTRDERELLDYMITISDNDSATDLWFRVGRAEGIQAFLDRHGIEGIYPDPDDYWGASLASPKALALFLNNLVWGDILDHEDRDLVIRLMSEVIPEQSWGIKSAVSQDTLETSIIGMKDGWYPEEDGWWANSTGFILPGAGKPAYAIAIMTNQQDTFEYAQETIENVVWLIHKALYGDR